MAAHSETQRRLADALATRAGLERRLARSRKYAGSEQAEARRMLREEARRCDVLRDAILAADPLELDAVVDQR